MLDLDRFSMALPDLVSAFASLDDRLHERGAAEDPAIRAEAASLVRTLIGALGSSQSAFSRVLGLNERTVRDWCAGRTAPGPLALFAMRLLAQRQVQPPRLDSGRNALCASALAPHLDALAECAEKSGWSRAEIADAVRAWLDRAPS